MCHLIVLPGNSVKNKNWGKLVIEHYAPRYDSSFMINYDHWESGEQNINFDVELQKLQAHIASLPPDTKITLFTKSAGSLLGLIGIHSKIFKPARAVFFGIPLDLAADNYFKDSWAPLFELTVPAIAFHNVEDPTASYEFTKSILELHNVAIKLIATKESDHWYGDVETYDKFITK